MQRVSTFNAHTHADACGKCAISLTQPPIPSLPQVDRNTGKLSDTRQRFLGTRSPKLFAVSVRGQRAMLALSSRPWLGYSDSGRFVISPLSYEALDYAAVSAAVRLEHCM